MPQIGPDGNRSLTTYAVREILCSRIKQPFEHFTILVISGVKICLMVLNRSKVLFKRCQKALNWTLFLECSLITKMISSFMNKHILPLMTVTCFTTYNHSRFSSTSGQRFCTRLPANLFCTRVYLLVYSSRLLIPHSDDFLNSLWELVVGYIETNIF